MSSKPKPKWVDLVSSIPANYSGFRRIRFSRWSKPNWADLPSDVLTIILQRLGTIPIIEVAQKVCTAWCSTCKDPAMWRVIDLENSGGFYGKQYDRNDRITMHKHLVDRSQGQLEEIHIEYFGTIELLHYIADRSSKLRCLKLSHVSGIGRGELGEVLQKLPLLEEFSLCRTDIYTEDIEIAGRYCPLLKTLNINHEVHWKYDAEYDEYVKIVSNEKPVAIAKSFPELLHLQLIGNSMNNIGLEAILDGCPHLESLDLLECPNISLAGDLGIRCSQQIKYLRLPSDSIEDYTFNDYLYSLCYTCDFHLPSSWIHDDYDDFSNHGSYEDSDDWQNFKFMFKMSYIIKTKEKKEHLLKVLSKRKTKGIEKIVAKSKTKAKLDQFGKKKRERNRGHFRKFLIGSES